MSAVSGAVVAIAALVGLYFKVEYSGWALGLGLFALVNQA